MDSGLFNISPIDGRYKDKVKELYPIYSEYGLIRYRVIIEIEYLSYLIKILPELESYKNSDLYFIINEFDIDSAKEIKDIEKNTNHDVKAVEYYIQNKLDTIDNIDNIDVLKSFIHFGLTSQDVNSVAYSLQMNACMFYYTKLINDIELKLYQMQHDLFHVQMIGKTHGQAASPTSMGKELRVFYERLDRERAMLCTNIYYTKFGGATGNLNAHYVSYPNVDWMSVMDDFIHTLGNKYLYKNHILKRNHYTTQIDNYDFYSCIFDSVKRINTILIDLSQDIWTYISLDYFKLKSIKNEIGSSTMPHKINPIDFENSEGNLLLSNALLEFFSRKLPISRLQRDLTDSTIMRNIGSAFAYSFIAYKSLLKGLYKLEINKTSIENDLNKNYVIVVEAIQTILRKKGIKNAYEIMKDLTRGNNISKQDIYYFIDNLSIVDSETKKILKSITPFNYIGFLANP